MNTVLLVGRLTKDPEINHTRSGQAVASFTLAVDKGLSREKKEEAEAANRPTADFPRIIAWGKLAENAARYLGRGSQCAVLGRIQTGSYEDRDGKKVYTTDVIASNIEFLSKSSQNQGQNEPNYNSNTNTSQEYKNQSRGDYGSNNGDDFFDDDFSEVEDYGRIPF